MTKEETIERKLMDGHNEMAHLNGDIWGVLRLYRDIRAFSKGKSQNKAEKILDLIHKATPKNKPRYEYVVRIFSPMFNDYLSKDKKIVANNEKEALKIATDYYSPTSKIQVIPNGRQFDSLEYTEFMNGRLSTTLKNKIIKISIS